jgi:hypothetical protein
MEAPDKIYVSALKTSQDQDAFVGLAYELNKLNINPTEFIRKDTLLEWLESETKKIENMPEVVASLKGATIAAYSDVIKKINSL